MPKYTLPQLPYPYNALEPHIDARTMEIHHSKHHQGYCDKLNAALEKHPELFEKPLEELLKNINLVPQDIRRAVINHGGGYINHSLFWAIMGPNSSDEPSGFLAEAINNTFGGFEKFKEQFTNAALNIFGSGWAWLVLNNDQIEILSTPNQDSPLMENKIPIIGIDIWEHAYYLKYQWNRAEYIKNWWQIVNWQEAEKKYSEFKNV